MSYPKAYWCHFALVFICAYLRGALQTRWMTLAMALVVANLIRLFFKAIRA